MQTPVCLSAFLLLSLTACGTERVIREPYRVDVPGPVEYVPVPPHLLAPIPKATVPAEFTYAEALGLWADDRATIQKLNGRLAAIGVLDYEQDTGNVDN